MIEGIDGANALARYNRLVDRTNALIAEANARMDAQPHLIAKTVERLMRQASRRPKADG